MASVAPVGAVSAWNYMPAITPVRPTGEVNGVLGTQTEQDKKNAEKVNPLTGKPECETCKNRKYQDGSDENVSFKAAATIAPGAVAARVRGHEQEHVANAYDKAEQKGGKVLQASVALKTAICPECGKSYVAGGTTTTKIKYGSDPYSKNQKSSNYDALAGQNFDAAV